MSRRCSIEFVLQPALNPEQKDGFMWKRSCYFDGVSALGGSCHAIDQVTGVNLKQ